MNIAGHVYNQFLSTGGILFVLTEQKKINLLKINHLNNFFFVKVYIHIKIKFYAEHVSNFKLGLPGP